MKEMKTKVTTKPASKYKHQPTRKQIEGLKITLHKDDTGKTIGFTVWTDGYWVLDASIMMDKDEEGCRIYTGNRVQPLQFEFCDGKGQNRNFLELRSKGKSQ